mmetsp:Transcript_51740/g.58658  ORF Transcript_51740/g.58658 Transcript_51740/m.58658 type:complete len:299 (-) Transcript_51740:88-984(-)
MSAYGATATSEEDPIIGRGKCPNELSWKFNIEMLRFWGIILFIPFLVTGYVVTRFAVVFPPHDDISSVWDKIWNGAPSDFDETQTYVYQKFHFSHFCSVLDFNPAKTVSAILVMFHIIPICAFVIMHYFRVMSQTDPAFDNLKKATKIMTPIQFVFFLYFYLVFVNSPDGEINTPEGDNAFILHYIPYWLWQIAALLMAIQQCWYMSLKDSIPEWLTAKSMWMYLQSIVALVFVYHVMVFSFILNVPIFNTEEGVGRYTAMFIMWIEVVYAILIPAFFAYIQSKDGNDFEIVFKHDSP